MQTRNKETTWLKYVACIHCQAKGKVIKTREELLGYSFAGKKVWIPYVTYACEACGQTDRYNCNTGMIVYNLEGNDN